MSLCSLPYLGAVLDRASAISCGSDAVTCPVTGRIISLCVLHAVDDDAYIDTIGGDSDNKFWSSFPRDRNSMNYILGGPQKPDMMGMTVAEEQEAKKQ
jgi:hypothetical protein